MSSNKIIISLSLIFSSLLQANELVIHGNSIFAQKELGITALTHSQYGFSAIRDGKKHTIQNAFVDKTIRNIPSEKLEKFLKNGYLSVNKMSDGQYSLKANVKGLGGGPIGATVGAVAAGTLVQGAYHGALAGIAMGLSPFLTPVGAGAVVGVIRFWTLPAALLATKTAALSGAIVVGVATGPV